MSKTLERKVENLEKRVVEKAIGLDRGSEIEMLLSQLEALEQQEQTELSPSEVKLLRQEENAEVLRWYEDTYLKEAEEQ